MQNGIVLYATITTAKLFDDLAAALCHDSIAAKDGEPSHHVKYSVEILTSDKHHATHDKIKVKNEMGCARKTYFPHSCGSELKSSYCIAESQCYPHVPLKEEYSDVKCHHLM